MRFESSPSSCVWIDLRATGLLQAIAHHPTLAARPDPFAVEVPKETGIEATIAVGFPVQAIEPPESLPPVDRTKMAENLLGREVLDAARFPRVDFRGRYAGSVEDGRLSGDLIVKGVARPLAMSIQMTRSGVGNLVARGVWEGRLTDLGIKPFRALLGALRLDDWIRLRLEVSFAHH